MNMLYKTLEVKIENLVATVTLNRPEVRNAFNEVLIAELTSVFTSLAIQDEVDLVVLAANGKRFCAGADLSG